ncbi:polyisoprenoid-binding protein [Lysinibacillus sp. PLM2]|nr:polyisoprenoid-binding protein [Lysinibacillus sp. PLM2]
MDYAIDFPHSAISFTVKHMGIANVNGVFGSYSAIIKTPSIESLEEVFISFDIDVPSLSTSNQSRDKHLISADFFDADRFPKIKFTSSQIERLTASAFNLIGNLTIKGVTKPITFIVEYTGQVKNPWGQDTYGFTANTSINRYDFNLRYNKILESGIFLIGENVDVCIDLEIYPL